MSENQGRAPRQYAREIADEPDIEKRRELLRQVPADWRELIEFHVRFFWRKRREKNNAR